MCFPRLASPRSLETPTSAPLLIGHRAAIVERTEMKEAESLTIRIESLAYGGAGVGRAAGRVVFVPFAAPGDILRVRIAEDRGSYLKAEILDIIQPSPLRREPRCRHFGQCGGCTWQHVTYPGQLAAKESILRESVRRIGGTEPVIGPIVASPQEWGYRVRTRLKLGETGSLGYFAAGTNSLVEIEECPILDPRLAERIPTLRSQYAGGLARPTSPAAPPKSRGRTSGSDAPSGAAELAIGLGEADELLTSYSDPADREEAGGLGFTQANPEVNSRLQELVRDYAEESLGAGAPLLDLYCGDGNLSLPLAERARRIVGFDSSEAAIRRARRRAAELGAARADYWCASVESSRALILELSKETGCLILDPPRKGLKGLAGFVASLGIPLVLYVSCAPPALARDLRMFIASGYRIELLQPLDMFPQSYHLETIAVLKRSP